MTEAVIAWVSSCQQLTSSVLWCFLRPATATRLGGLSMRVFVTGASGHIGSAVVPELWGAGHQVVGLARSASSSAKLEAAGAEVLRGDLDDLDGLKPAAADAD